MALATANVSGNVMYVYMGYSARRRVSHTTRTLSIVPGPRPILLYPFCLPPGIYPVSVSSRLQDFSDRLHYSPSEASALSFALSHTVCLLLVLPYSPDSNRFQHWVTLPQCTQLTSHLFYHSIRHYLI